MDDERVIIPRFEPLSAEATKPDEDPGELREERLRNIHYEEVPMSDLIEKIVELVEDRVGPWHDRAPGKRLARMVIAKMAKRMGVFLRHAARRLGLHETTLHYYAFGRADRERSRAVIQG